MTKADSHGVESDGSGWTLRPVVGPPPPLDPECLVSLTADRGRLPVALLPEDIEWLRETGRQMDMTDEEISHGGLFDVFERQVPGPPGDPDITVLVCLPASRDRAVPALFNIHGGGMVAGNRRNALQFATELAVAERIALVSVEYRVAPEYPDPAPVEDCYAGLQWTAENAAELGIDPDQIVIAGRSAGGGLAAGVALLARDRGGPALFGQLLVGPMLDDRNNTVSAIQLEGVGIWDRIANQTGWQALLGERQGGPDVSIYASPARAVDLSGLPPTFIDVGSAETFRDESVEYASKIWAAGGDAELHVWPGGYHGYDARVPEAQVSIATRWARHDWLRRLLERKPQTRE